MPATTTSAGVICGETTLIPPQLPPHLLAVHDLQPIKGKPTNDKVKAIHAVIGALSATVHLFTAYDPNLHMQLSQHLFGAQMAVYQATYLTNILPNNRNIYTPPTLPVHIPSTLKQVVGAPSDEDIMLTKGALRCVENLGISTCPQLFDAELNMKLSQHLFNLQLARYMHDLVQGESTVDGEKEELPAILPPTEEPQGEVNNISDALDSESREHMNAPVPQPEPTLKVPLEFAQLGKIMESMKDTMDGSKDVLENMNRILISMKRDQCVSHSTTASHRIQKDPLNRHGSLASECGLPRLHYFYDCGKGRYVASLNTDYVAHYLKFFGVGSDLIEGDEEPRLIDGKYNEAERLILAQVGV